MWIDTLGSTRDLDRLHEIAGVLMRHGLGDSMRRLGLADLLARAGHLLNHDHAADLARLPPPVQVRLAMEEPGPTFVKLGQIMAGRADLFGPDWIAEFEKLHSCVPTLPLDELRTRLREDLGDEPEAVFARFDVEPPAGASVAQVHRAQLHDGTEVVVKIRRLGIHEKIEADLRLLKRMAALAESELPALKPYGPTRLVHEFSRSLQSELDLAGECRTAERTAANLASLPFIVIPRVHWQHTGEHVNVQDYVDGIPGEQLDRLRDAGLDPPLLAQRGARGVEDDRRRLLLPRRPAPRQCALPAGQPAGLHRLGMVGRLSSRRREELLQLLLGLVPHQPRAVADALLDWTGDGPRDDLDALKAEIETFVEQYHGTPLAQLSLGGMLGDVTAILREHRLALPGDLALLIKAFISLESMGRGLDPNFHIASEALPILRQAARARYRPRVLAQRSRQSVWRALTRSRNCRPT